MSSSPSVMEALSLLVLWHLPLNCGVCRYAKRGPQQTSDLPAAISLSKLNLRKVRWSMEPRQTSHLHPDLGLRRPDTGICQRVYEQAKELQ
jgi:hypothetical protein